jgi:hypothetical protein
VGDHWALAAGLAVGSPPALKTLHLDGCGFGDTGMLALTAALATLRTPLLTLTSTGNQGVTLGPTLLLLAHLLGGGARGHGGLAAVRCGGRGAGPAAGL